MSESVVTIGTFDGVHLGHQALLERTHTLARESDRVSVALTFPRPPQNYLGRPKKLLLPPKVRLALLKEHVDRVEVIDFPQVRGLSPEEFASKVLRERLEAEAVVVGEGFRFGHDRLGDISILKELGGKLGFAVEVVEAVTVEGETVSSTAIRTAIEAGDIERATRLLGRPPCLWGEVVPGAGQGRTLGFPTANLAVDPELLVPAEGVYAAQVLYRDEGLAGALYIGRRPTFDGAELSIEVYILDGEGLQLYGEELEVQLLTRFREDKRFASPEELKAQIRADVEATREFFARSTTRSPGQP